MNDKYILKVFFEIPDYKEKFKVQKLDSNNRIIGTQHYETLEECVGLHNYTRVFFLEREFNDFPLNTDVEIKKLNVNCYVNENKKLVIDTFIEKPNVDEILDTLQKVRENEYKDLYENSFEENKKRTELFINFKGDDFFQYEKCNISKVFKNEKNEITSYKKLTIEELRNEKHFDKITVLGYALKGFEKEYYGRVAENSLIESLNSKKINAICDYVESGSLLCENSFIGIKYACEESSNLTDIETSKNKSYAPSLYGEKNNQDNSEKKNESCFESKETFEINKKNNQRKIEIKLKSNVENDNFDY